MENYFSVPQLNYDADGSDLSTSGNANYRAQINAMNHANYRSMFSSSQMMDVRQRLDQHSAYSSQHQAQSYLPPLPSVNIPPLPDKMAARYSSNNVSVNSHSVDRTTERQNRYDPSLLSPSRQIHDTKGVNMADITRYTKRIVENALTRPKPAEIIPERSSYSSHAEQNKKAQIQPQVSSPEQPQSNHGDTSTERISDEEEEEEDEEEMLAEREKDVERNETKPQPKKLNGSNKFQSDPDLNESLRKTDTGSHDLTVKTCKRCKAMFTSLTDIGVTTSKEDEFTCQSCTESAAEDGTIGDFQIHMTYGDKTRKINMGEKNSQKTVSIKILGLERSNQGEVYFEMNYGKKIEKVHINREDLSKGEMLINFKTEKKIMRPFIPDHVRQFPCSDCGDSFLDTTSLADHKLTHPCLKPWVCLECGKEFKYNNLMQRHKISHTDIRDFVCNFCNKAFRTKANMKRHKLSAHKEAAEEELKLEALQKQQQQALPLPVLKPVEVDQNHHKTKQKKTSDNDDDMEESLDEMEDEEEMDASDAEDDEEEEDEDGEGEKAYRKPGPKSASNKIRYNCKMCQKGFSNKGKWKRHELYHFQMRMPVCEICGKSFVDKDYLMEHVRTHEDMFMDYICKECGMEFPFKDELQHHILGHASPDENSLSNSDLQANISSRSGGGGETYKCTECDKTFRSNYILQRHVVTHNRATCQCQECGKFYSCRYNLTQHMMIHNTKSQFICDQCGESFKVKQYLSRHMIKHREQKTWACTLCDLKFYRQGNLRHHMKQHVEEKPFQCNHCQKSFVREKTLEEHILLTHTKERPYQCPVCGRGFGLQRMIKPHMKIHSGHKEFKCEECGKMFTYKSNLNQHMMVHSGEKPFICQYCGKGFARSKYLNDHMKTHNINSEVMSQTAQVAQA